MGPSVFPSTLIHELAETRMEHTVSKTDLRRGPPTGHPFAFHHGVEPRWLGTQAANQSRLACPLRPRLSTARNVPEAPHEPRNFPTRSRVSHQAIADRFLQFCRRLF